MRIQLFPPFFMTFISCHGALIWFTGEVFFFLSPFHPVSVVVLRRSGHAGAMGSAPADFQHHKIWAEEKPSSCAGCAQVLRLHGQHQAEIPQLYRYVNTSITLPRMYLCVPPLKVHLFGSQIKMDHQQRKAQSNHQSRALMMMTMMMPLLLL